MNNQRKDWSRRDFLHASAAGSLGILLPAGLASRAAGEESVKRPNVLMIVCDQMRRDATTVYGGRNIPTPGLERMAREGMTFDNALSTCPLCTPYRGMLMTGRYGTHSGIVLNRVEVNTRQICLGHVFRDAGYHTGYLGKWHLTAGNLKTIGRNPDHPEFVPPGALRLGFDHWQAYNIHEDFRNYWYYEDEPLKIYSDEYQTDALTSQAIQFMENHRSSAKPFFLVVSPHPPHPPFIPEQCPPGYLEQIPTKLFWSPNVYKDHYRRANPLEVRCYLAMVRNLDDNLIRILDYLDRTGLSENTILVFTSDHGEMHGSHDRVNKMRHYSEAIDIPLLMRWPGHIPAGVRTDALQTPMDHFPTLCSLAALRSPDWLDGEDLSPVVLGVGEGRREAALLMNYTCDWCNFITDSDPPEFRGVRTRRYTYARFLHQPEELFDNREDPYQMLNLANGNNVTILNQMRETLKQLSAEAHDDFLTGADYRAWYDEQRNLLRTARGPVLLNGWSVY